MHECEDTVAENDEVAEICNAYFSNIAAEILFKDEHATPAWGDNMQSFNFQTVNHDCFARKLQMINVKKATEYDNIQAQLLRLAQNELTHPIANLINTTLAMSAFPDQLKCAGSSPLFKEDNPNKMNFRPISILTGYSKLYEPIVNDQLLNFFTRLFIDSIGGFRKGYNWQPLLVKCADNWKNALEK